MARFTLNPSAGQVFLPGYGRIRPGEVLMGEQWRRFAPTLLLEVPDPPASPPLEVRAMKPASQPLEMPVPVTESPLEMEEPPTNPDRKLLTEDDPPKKRMVRRRR